MEVPRGSVPKLLLKQLFPVIAVSYDTGKIQLCDVENACSLHTLTLDAPSTTMCWVAGSMLEGDGTEGGETTPDVFQDMSSHYLPRLPTFAKGCVFCCALLSD